MKDNNIWGSRRIFYEQMELVNCYPEATQSCSVQTLPACQINISNTRSCSGLPQVLTVWCCSSPGLWGLNHLDDHQHLELACLAFPWTKTVIISHAARINFPTLTERPVMKCQVLSKLGSVSTLWGTTLLAVQGERCQRRDKLVTRSLDFLHNYLKKYLLGLLYYCAQAFWLRKSN